MGYSKMVHDDWGYPTMETPISSSAAKVTAKDGQDPAVAVCGPQSCAVGGKNEKLQGFRTAAVDHDPKMGVVK